MTGSEKTQHIVNSMKFKLAVLLNRAKSETDRALRFGARALYSRSRHTHKKGEITV